MKIVDVRPMVVQNDPPLLGGSICCLCRWLPMRGSWVWVSGLRVAGIRGM